MSCLETGISRRVAVGDAELCHVCNTARPFLGLLVSPQLPDNHNQTASDMKRGLI